MNKRELKKRLAAALVFHKLTKGTYVCGDGRKLVNVHMPAPACFELGCVIHWPTDPHQDWPTSWHNGHMWRTCPCGADHLDLNDLNFSERVYPFPFELGGCSCHCNCCGRKAP